MAAVRASQRTLLIAGTLLFVLIAAGGVTAGWKYHTRAVQVTDKALGVTVETTNDATGGGRITVAAVEATGPTYEGFARPLGKVVEIKVVDGRLTGTATITFAVPPGADIDAVSVFTADDQRRPVLAGGRVDAAARTISVVTDHFSQWWLSEWEMADLYGEDWAQRTRDNALTRTIERILQIPPPLACDRPALSVTVEVNTFGKQVDVCPRYAENGDLVISVGNGIGAPLLFTAGPGLRYGSVDPPDETVFNSLVRFVRTEAGDEQVAIGGGRRVTFVVEPDKARDGRLTLSAEVNLGYAALDFSGALMGVLMPYVDDDARLQAAFKRADQAAKYSECVLREAQGLGRRTFTNAGEMYSAFVLAYSACEKNNLDMIRRFLADPAREVADWVKKTAGTALLNNLPQHVSRMVKRLMGVIPSAGAVITQPLFTAVAAYRSDGRPYELRMAVTEPPLNRLGEVLPVAGEENYATDPGLDGYLTTVRRYGVVPDLDALPRTGDPCVDKAPINQPWNSAAWLDPTFGSRGYRLAFTGDSVVHADVHLTYVRPEQRAAVAAYLHSWYGAGACDTTVEGYRVRTKPLESTHSDDDVVMRYNWAGYPNSDVISDSWTVTAYDPTKGYLLVIAAATGERGEQFSPKGDDAVMTRALDRAYRFAAVKANQMLGARFHTA